MNAQTKIEPPTLAKLREPFPPNQISKLPKESKAQSDARKADRSVAINCKVCGGWHHKNAVHLDYVGHAALTDRLLDTDPHWSWEPVSYGPDGLPAVDKNGGLWIKLTVLGVTRLGYGSADGKTGGDAVKELIGDALRNAAMRFGAALDLWHKGDLHADEAEGEAAQEPAGDMPDTEYAKIVQLLKATNTDAGPMLKHYGVKNIRQLNQAQFGEAVERLSAILAKMAKAETNELASDIDADSIPY